MKKFWKDFCLRGAVSAVGGPIILAIIYGILGATGAAESLSPGEVCTGILSITLLAFLVAGMTAIYQLEQLPLLTATLLHGGVLYLCYILVYLLNGWLEHSLGPILGFSGIFVAGYALIWLVIYLITRSNTRKINQKLKERS